MNDRAAMNDRTVSNTSLYAAAIAIVSGVYSLLAATGGAGMTSGAWIMLLVGAIAVIHGVVLLTPAVERLGGWSGPLMIAYAIVMLVNRAALPMGMGPSGTGGAMGPGMMDGGTGFGGMMGGFMGTMGPGGGVGMVALALLMLASGIIMTVRSDGM